MKKPQKPTRKDIARQKAIEKRVKAEGVELGNPQGKERFQAVLKRASTKRLT